ncbi:MAG: ABC-type transport system, involved in lipoprotein release, permease component [Chitinophagaceae bacterium]|nr:ABC-type transport system, involved in lipoprotein release, permease component [Chitinophagaceae bacterium]
MLKNYFRIAWRNVIRHKAYTAINIIGLAIGIAACLLLFTVVKYELSYDKFQPNYDHIYHVASTRVNEEGTYYGEGVPFPAYDALRAQCPQAKTGAMFSNYNCQVTVLDPKDANAFSNKKFIEETGIFFSDPQIFSVFQYKWLIGSPDVLKAPNVAVLTKKMAEKYYGKWQSAIGGLIKLDNTATVKIAGVLEDIAVNTDFPLGVIASYETMKSYPNVYGYTTDFGNVTSSFQAFMLLPPNVSAEGINKLLVRFSNEHYNKGSKKNDKVYNFLQPLKEVHFDNRIGTFGNHITSKTTLWTLSLIGLFIIIMACINFINLATAQAVGRSKEVGIRKVLGSNRRQLFWQVIGETWIIVLTAIILASVIATICLPYIKNVASIEEKLSLLNLSTIGFMAALAVVVTLLAGTYPSLILSGFKPALALKNKITSATVGGISLRRGLVVTQFAISQVLIIGTIVAVSQMNFIRKADLGFNKEAVLVLNSNVDSSVNLRQPAFKQKLLSINGVKSVSFSSDVPSSESNNSGNFAFDHKPDEKFDIFRKFGDEDYFKTYGLQLVAGRIFTKSDTINEIVVNETLVKKLGIKTPADILGHVLRVNRNSWRTIVGVVKDFKTNSLRESVKPLMLAQRAKRYYFTGVKLTTSNLKQTQAEIEKVWNQFFPEYVYAPTFMDERINKFYEQENQLSLLYKIFAGIAILISCLGLYGLVSFMAAQRTKEVGIRKVLGASVANIIFLFSKEFTILILVAFAVAVPVAYYMMSNWLNNFAYKVSLSIWVFALAILSSVIIAWLTVGYKSIKAALSNPVKSLRSE